MPNRQCYSTITLKEFTALPVDEQAQHTWEHGRYLMNRQSQRTVANLHAVGSFYVEIWYDDQESNAITAIACLDNVSKLDAYLNGIFWAACPNGFPLLLIKLCKPIKKALKKGL